MLETAGDGVAVGGKLSTKILLLLLTVASVWNEKAVMRAAALVLDGGQLSVNGKAPGALGLDIKRMNA